VFLFSSLGTNALAVGDDPQITQIHADFLSHRICGNLWNLRNKKNGPPPRTKTTAEIKGVSGSARRGTWISGVCSPGRRLRRR
jgi:hypothetical protein